MMGALCGIAVLGGCGGDGEPVEPEPPRASAVSVSPETAMLSSLGETVTSMSQKQLSHLTAGYYNN